MFSSPTEDLRKGTLGAVPGTLAKLQYVSSLRQRDGKYYHWGFVRMHGEATANAAFGEAHSEIFALVLRTPLRSLWEEADAASKELNQTVGNYMQELAELGDTLVPANLQGGVKRHFKSVLLALCFLAGVQVPLQIDRAASRFPPPGL